MKIELWLNFLPCKKPKHIIFSLAPLKEERERVLGVYMQDRQKK